MHGELALGPRLTIRDLVATLGTSITPVRVAILRLIQDHALTQKSPREVRVAIQTQKDYLETFAIRIRLDSEYTRCCYADSGHEGVCVCTSIISGMNASSVLKYSKHIFDFVALFINDSVKIPQGPVTIHRVYDTPYMLI